jgi:mevalonate kinase
MELFVTGRLCLFGEHSDWAAGYRRHDAAIPTGQCLVAGTDQGLRARAEAQGGWLEIETRTGARRLGPWRVPAEVGALHAEGVRGGFFSYAAGAAAEVMEHHAVGGARLVIESDLPAGKGLSSSAAVCVLLVRALGRLYDLDLSPREEMELAFAGERRAGSECGRMDQICAYGRGPWLLVFDRDDLGVEPVETSAPFHLLIVDLARDKDTRRILSDLNACYPDRADPVAVGVREALGERNHEILTRARAALRTGDPEALGRLMAEAQELFFRRVAPACPELEAPGLREVLAHPATRELAYGGKGVGSQGDGSAQLVARGPEERTRLAERLAADLGLRSLPLTL